VNVERHATNEKHLSVFVSYQRNDSTARRLAEAIFRSVQSEFGHDFDSANLQYSFATSVTGYREHEPDPAMWSELSAEIGQANCVLVLFTPKALTSSQVDAEYRYAKFWSAHRKLELVPVAVGNVQLPFHYSNPHQLSISDRFDARDQSALFERLRAVRTLLMEDQPLEPENGSELADPLTPQELLTRQVVSLMRRFGDQPLSVAVAKRFIHQIVLRSERYASQTELALLPRFASHHIQRDRLWGDLRCDIWAESSESVWAVKTLMSRPTRLADYVASSIISRHALSERRSSIKHNALRGRLLVFWLVFGEIDMHIAPQDLKEIKEEIEYRVERLEPREQLPQLLCLSAQRELRALDGFLRDHPREG
jgi:hypothetical protein